MNTDTKNEEITQIDASRNCSLAVNAIKVHKATVKYVTYSRGKIPVFKQCICAS